MTENQIRKEVLKHIRSKIKLQLNVFETFKAPKAPDFFWESWSFEKEYLIRFGSKIGYADLVLLIDNKPLIIVECKASGLIGYGKKQLESYLNASKTNLGIFTNNPDPDKWRYYDNSIGFDEISLSTFWERVRSSFNTKLDIETQVQQQKQHHIEARAKELAYANPSIIQARTDEMIEAEAKARVTENAIQDRVAQRLQEKIKQLEHRIKSQQVILDESRNRAMWGWILFGIAVFFWIMSHQ